MKKMQHIEGISTISKGLGQVKLNVHVIQN